jgi:hypothetical protein
MLNVLFGRFRLKHEEATRQQGGLFFRENSSNGGKAIRTFWRNTMVGKMACQGLNRKRISPAFAYSYWCYQMSNSEVFLRLAFALTGPAKIQTTIESDA